MVGGVDRYGCRIILAGLLGELQVATAIVSNLQSFCDFKTQDKKNANFDWSDFYLLRSAKHKIAVLYMRMVGGKRKVYQISRRNLKIHLVRMSAVCVSEHSSRQDN